MYAVMFLIALVLIFTHDESARTKGGKGARDDEYETHTGTVGVPQR